MYSEEEEEIKYCKKILSILDNYHDNPTNCQAECYDNCSGKIIERNFISNYKQNNQKNNLYNNYDQIYFCDFHYNCILTKNNGVKPEIYYEWNIGESIYDLINETCNYSNLHTFWYCERHDDGFLIKDNDTTKVPDWCKMCECTNCDRSWWVNKGVIDYDGNRVIELGIIYDDNYYDKMCGGFKFKFYSNKIYISENNIESNTIGIDENSELMFWFNKK